MDKEKELIIKKHVINKKFYERDPLEVAKDILGCYLIRRTEDDLIISRIVEVEAYKKDDPACHAYKGKTKRSITLFKEPGLSYVYLVYGMYNCINVVTEKIEVPSAILIRAVEPISENCSNNTNGPGKLCKALNITKTHNEIDLTSFESCIFIVNKSANLLDKEVNNKNTELEIIQTTRIGISQAVDYPWRFYIKNNKYVSKK